MPAFSCPLQCQKCAYPGCSKTTCIALPFCPKHTREVCGLQMKKSGLHGKGIFAYGPAGTVVFGKGARVAYFGGELMGEAALRRRYGTGGDGPYVAAVSSKMSLDGACQRHLGAMINHGKGRDANVRYAGQGASLHLVAKRAIYAGEEIRVDYELGKTDIRNTTPFHKTRGGWFHYSD